MKEVGMCVRGFIVCMNVMYVIRHELIMIFFFFSSRRRHTRSLCDWSSDVCSSDLFSLRQRPHFIYCPFLVAAAPSLFKMPISRCGSAPLLLLTGSRCGSAPRSEEHTSELQSHSELVCRLLLEKKKKLKKKKKTLVYNHYVV